MGFKNSYQEGIVIENTQISDSVYKLKLSGDFRGNPGQFYMLKAWEGDPLLPRPLSICDIDEESITFLYLVVGKGTGIFSELKVGNKIEVLGPLGNGFELPDDENIALIAGGIGLAPMLYLAKSLNHKPDLYCGFRTGSYFIEEMRPFVNNIYIFTEDGSVGEKGYVTSGIEDRYDSYFACGPNAMMKSLQDLDLNAKGYFSLEAHMACGIGACLGCSVKTKSGMKRVCHEGPVFNSEEVIFYA